MDFVSINGRIIERTGALIAADNHSYRYGDGFFETIKVKSHRILLSALHADRIKNSLEVLEFNIPVLFSFEKLEEEILSLCKKNRNENFARVRISFSNGNGGLYDGDDKLNYLIESLPLSDAYNRLNENGYIAGIFPSARKSCDQFSNYKTSSHLVYAMAARYAKENKWNECFVMNTNGNISDSTIANIFWKKGPVIYTVPLSEGCINGVMRKHLLNTLPTLGYKTEEKILTEGELLNAEELFLSNAIVGLRWVKQFRNRHYEFSHAKKIFAGCIQTISF